MKGFGFFKVWFAFVALLMIVIFGFIGYAGYHLIKIAEHASVSTQISTQVKQ